MRGRKDVERRKEGQQESKLKREERNEAEQNALKSKNEE